MTSDLDHNPVLSSVRAFVMEMLGTLVHRFLERGVGLNRKSPITAAPSVFFCLLVTLRHQTSNGCIFLCLNVFPSAASFAFRCLPRVCRCCTDAEKHLRFAQTACALACGYSWERSGQTLQQKADFGLHQREKVAVIICWGAGTPRAVSAFTAKEKCVWRC